MMLCIVLALLPQPVRAAVVGVVTVAEGESHLIRGSGYFKLEKGIDLEEGDVIHTKDAATVQAEMRDGSIFEVGPASEFYINEYRLRDDRTVESAAVSLVKGWLRFVAAKLRPSRRYEINLSVATIGIRGTEGVVSVDADSSSLLLNQGEVEFIEVNQAGELGVAGLVQPGEFIRRDRGKPFSKHRTASKSFLAKMPGRFKTRPKRYKSTLKRRGVKPKLLRTVRDQDLERIFRSNPRVRQKSKARFGTRTRDIDQKRGRKPISQQTKPAKITGAGKQKQKKIKGRGSKK